MRTSSLFLTVCFFLLIGCAEKPKAIGAGLIDPNDVFIVSDTTIFSISDSAYTVPIIGGFSSSNLVGRISANEELVGLYRFTPTALVDSLKASSIDTVELRLFVNYSLSPSSPPIMLEVREALQSWAQSTFNTDSMKMFSIGGTAIGTFSDSMNVSSNIFARIDTTVIRQWANSYKDTTQPLFHGFAVQAKQGNTTGVVGFLPFGSFTSVDPRLVIKYTKNGIRDSLIFTSGDDTYAARFITNPTLSKFEVRGAFGIRGKVRFDLKFLDYKPIVNNATMTLVVDSVNSLRSIHSPDSLIALVSLSGTVVDSSSTSQFAVGKKSIDPKLGQTYVFTVTEITQRWINSLSANEGLSIRWAYETNTADRVVLHSSTDAVRGPTLKIIYSRK